MDHLKQNTHRQQARSDRRQPEQGRGQKAVSASDEGHSGHTETSSDSNIRAQSEDPNLLQRNSSCDSVRAVAKGEGHQVYLNKVMDQKQADMQDEHSNDDDDDANLSDSEMSASQMNERSSLGEVFHHNESGKRPKRGYSTFEEDEREIDPNLYESEILSQGSGSSGDPSYDEIHPSAITLANASSDSGRKEGNATIRKRAENIESEDESTHILVNRAKRNKLNDIKAAEVKDSPGRIFAESTGTDLDSNPEVKIRNGRMPNEPGINTIGSNSDTLPKRLSDINSLVASKRTTQLDHDAESIEKCIEIKSGNHEIPRIEHNDNVEKKEKHDKAEGPNTAFDFLDFENMPGSPIQSFDEDALAEGYGKLLAEYEPQLVDLLEQWGALNKKIEKWIVRGSEMQCVREQCMLKHAEAQANEQVKLATQQREELVTFCRRMQKAFSSFFDHSV